MIQYRAIYLDENGQERESKYYDLFMSVRRFTQHLNVIRYEQIEIRFSKASKDEPMVKTIKVLKVFDKK